MITPGRCLGLGASALSGRAAYMSDNSLTPLTPEK
nr:MAG TPA: hypothetical protein [Caudoviricetes sp.]